MTEGKGEVKKLPEGWIETSFESLIVFLTDYQANGSFASLKENVRYYDKQNYAILVRLKDLRKNLEHSDSFVYTDEKGFSFLKKSSLTGGEILVANVGAGVGTTVVMPKPKQPDEKGFSFLKKSSLTGGEILVANVGAGVGTTVVMPKPKQPATLAPNMFLVILPKKINKQYFFCYCQSLYFWRQIGMLAGGSGQPKINKKQYGSINIPLSPLNEQERIIEKIEELFSDIDQGVESLKTAQKQLKVYRQAVLKWAFEGKLTEEWRKRQSTLKTGEALLAQIKAERENRYQQQLAEWEKAVETWEAIGKVGKKPTKPQPFSSELLSQNESKSLSQLPETWNWVTLRELTILEPRNGYSPKPVSYFTNTKSLTLTATTSGKFDPKYFKYIDEKIDPSSYLWLEENDVLIQRGNTIEYVGTAAIYRGKSQEFIYPDLMMRTRFASCLNVCYVYQAINSEYSRAYFRDRATGTAGSMPKINKGTVNSLPIPLPSREEQEQIIEEIESRISICDQLEATIIENLQKAEALRQSILKQAFEGKLVPQDPNDEPAEKLLERIQTEREAKQPKASNQLKIKGL